METSSKIAIVLLLFSVVAFSQQPDNIFKKNKNGDLPATRLAVTKNLTNQAQILKQINIFRIEDGLTPINPDKANDFFANTLPQNIYDNADGKIIRANVNVPIERLPGFVAGEKYNLWQNLEVVKATVSNEGMQKYFQPVLERFQLPADIKKQLSEQFLSGKFEDYKLLPGSVLEQVAFLSPPYTCPAPLKTSDGSGTATEPKINLYQKTVFLPFIGDNDPDYFTKNSLDFQFVSGSDDKYLFVVGIIRHQYENTADWTGLLNIFWYKVDVADLPIQPVKKAELSKKPTVIQEAEIVADAESQLAPKNAPINPIENENTIIINESELSAFIKDNNNKIFQLSIDKEHDLDHKFWYMVKEFAWADHFELKYVVRAEGLSFDFRTNSELALISALIFKDGTQILIDDNFIGPNYSLSTSDYPNNISFAISGFFKSLPSTYFTLYRSDYSNLNEWISSIKDSRDKIEYAIWREPGADQFRFVKIVDVPNAGHLEVGFTLKSQEGWGIDTKNNMNTLIAVLDINSDIAQRLFDYLKSLNYKVSNYGNFANNITQANYSQTKSSNLELMPNNSWFTVNSQGEVMNLITKKDQKMKFTDGSEAIVTEAGEILAEGKHNANRWINIKFTKGHSNLWGSFAAWGMGHISGIFISRDKEGDDDSGLGEGGTGIINLAVKAISK